MSREKVASFGQDSPMQRPAQPVELASAYVMLAEPMSSYVSGATIAVTGGRPCCEGCQEQSHRSAVGSAA
jgi:NAD(P)-dependent dehydrogenase (short-subunit alcohol dehydrogenase family)